MDYILANEKDNFSVDVYFTKSSYAGFSHFGNPHSRRRFRLRRERAAVLQSGVGGTNKQYYLNKYQF